MTVSQAGPSLHATMVRELNHRAKNILQVIASVLTLERGRAKTDEARAALDRASTRLQTMAQVHAMLYLIGDDAERVEMGPYLAALCHAVTDGLRPSAEPVALDIACDTLRWPVETAGQVGLIVVEALTNACKHAFAPGGSPTVRLQLHRIPGGDFRLEISDNGQGYNGADGKGGVGTALLHAFARTLHAELTIASAPGHGTRVTLSLPAPEAMFPPH